MAKFQKRTKGLPGRVLRNIVQSRTRGHDMVPKLVSNRATQRTKPFRPRGLRVKKFNTSSHNQSASHPKPTGPVM